MEIAPSGLLDKSVVHFTERDGTRCCILGEIVGTAEAKNFYIIRAFRLPEMDHWPEVGMHFLIHAHDLACTSTYIFNHASEALNWYRYLVGHLKPKLRVVE